MQYLPPFAVFYFKWIHCCIPANSLTPSTHYLSSSHITLQYLAVQFHPYMFCWPNRTLVSVIINT
jgi:hypothetical protein